jgi:hypothetical protein
VHREILRVVLGHARHASETYTWLRHVASIAAQSNGLIPSPDPEMHRLHVEAFVRNVRSVASELAIEIDSQLNQELRALVDALPVPAGGTAP